MSGSYLLNHVALFLILAVIGAIVTNPGPVLKALVILTLAVFSGAMLVVAWGAWLGSH